MAHMLRPLSKAQIVTPGYRRAWSATVQSRVDLPAPVGPKIRVCPTSPTCRFTRNGVAPVVAACRSGGEPGRVERAGVLFPARPDAGQRQQVGQVAGVDQWPADVRDAVAG